MYVYICMYVYIGQTLCAEVCIYTCMYVCVYVCIQYRWTSNSALLTGVALSAIWIYVYV